MSLSSIPHFTCVNHNFWPSFANCRRAKDSTMGTPADTASVFLGISTGALRHSNYILTTRLGTTLSLFFVVLATKFPNLVQKKKSALPGDPCFKTAESLFFHPLTLKIRYETLNPHLPFSHQCSWWGTLVETCSTQWVIFMKHLYLHFFSRTNCILLPTLCFGTAVYI